MPEDSIFNNKFSEAPKSIEMNQQTVQINKVDQNYKHIDGEQFLSFTEPKYLVHFKPNSANIDSSAFEILNKVVEIIHKVPNSEIIIEGYADSYGGNVFNKRLSEFRANIIKSYLIGRGVDSLRITAFGFGSDMPIADNLGCILTFLVIQSGVIQLAHLSSSGTCVSTHWTGSIF